MRSISRWDGWKSMENLKTRIKNLFLQSLGILGSIPAAALILSLFCLLLYLMSRCCDRKPRPAHSITSLKVTLSIVTVLCCAAIGLGEFKSSIKKGRKTFPTMTKKVVFLHVKNIFFSPHFVAAAPFHFRFFPCTYKHHKFPPQLHESCSQSSSESSFSAFLSPSNQIWFSFELWFFILKEKKYIRIFLFHRVVWKWWLTQWTSWSFDSGKKSWQPRFFRSESNQRSRTHFDAKNSPAIDRTRWYFRRTGVKSDGAVDANQLLGHGAEKYNDCYERCRRYSATVDGNFLESYFECKFKGRWWGWKRENVVRRVGEMLKINGAMITAVVDFIWCNKIIRKSEELLKLFRRNSGLLTPNTPSANLLKLSFCHQSLTFSHQSSISVKIR